MLYKQTCSLYEERSFERRSKRRATPMVESSKSIEESVLFSLLENTTQEIDFHAQYKNVIERINHLLKQSLYSRKNIL